MSGLKVYLHLELAEFPEHTSKIQIPKSWVENQQKDVRDILRLFLPAYLKKFPLQRAKLLQSETENESKKETETETEIETVLDCVHLCSAGGDKIFSNAKVGSVLENHGDYYVKQGRYVKEEVVEGTVFAAAANGLRCKNYGCNQQFREEDNHDEACRHHCAPPIFHDTMKCWSCCKERKAYDFESFQQIQGCTVGRHSTEVKKVAIAPSPNDNSSVNNGNSAPALKSIAEFNTANPSAATAASSAVQTVTARKSTRNSDGTARCQRKGCQKVFPVAENVGNCCVYHKGQPIFHDAVKFWSCCPQSKCYDFDAFLAVAGCSTGLHDDGEIDLEV